MLKKNRNLGSERSQVQALSVTQRKRARVVLERKETRRVTGIQQTAIARQVAVVCRVDGVVTRVLAELEREERRLAPRDVGVDVDLVASVAQMRKPAPADRSQIHLRPRCQIHEPNQFKSHQFSINSNNFEEDYH